MLRSRFNRTFGLAVACLMAFVLSACSTVGQTKPQNTEDTLQYGKATLTGAYKAITQNNEAKTISLAAADSATKRADQGRIILAEAEKLMRAPGGYDTATVQGKLGAALAILEPLLRELQATLPKPKAEAEPDNWMPNIAVLGLFATVEALNFLVNGIISLLGLFGATERVSQIIAARIAEKRTSWNPEELAEVEGALDDAANETHASVERRRAEEAGQTSLLG